MDLWSIHGSMVQPLIYCPSMDRWAKDPWMDHRPINQCMDPINVSYIDPCMDNNHGCMHGYGPYMDLWSIHGSIVHWLIYGPSMDLWTIHGSIVHPWIYCQSMHLQFGPATFHPCTYDPSMHQLYSPTIVHPLHLWFIHRFIVDPWI